MNSRCLTCGIGLDLDYLALNTRDLLREGSEPELFCSEQCLVRELLTTLETAPRHIRRTLRHIPKEPYR